MSAVGGLLRRRYPRSLVSIDDACYRRWIFANEWAEAAGLGTTFVVGILAAPAIRGIAGVVPVLMGALVAVVLGTLLEGVLVGAAQERVLRTRLVQLPRRAWVAATALGAGLAWLLGMVPSTLMALIATTPAGPATAPSALAQYALAAALGMVTGPVLGVAQWTVLRRHVRDAGRWLWANALAWAVGMPMIFIGMDQVPWEGPAALTFLAVYAACGATGLVVGAIHGRVLLQLLQRPQVRSEEPRGAARALVAPRGSLPAKP